MPSLSIFPALVILMTATLSIADPIRVLILDGRNNHDWAGTSDSLRSTLESTGRFEVEVSTAPELEFPRIPHRAPREEDKPALAEVRKQFEAALKASGAKQALAEKWRQWSPDFAAADVVVLNYNGDDWPEPVREGYLEFVRSGGGTVLVHAANNAFRNWDEFNDLIGLGWRPALFGKALKIDPETGAAIFPPVTELPNGGSSSHGSKHPFPIVVRAPEHPIMQGLPARWMHASDELYHNMRGPAANLTVLSSAFSDPEQRGSGLHEPITWEVSYGKGRAIVTSLGHLWPGDVALDPLHCVGFQTVFARSCEYAATAAVTLPIPDGFPSEDEISVRRPSSVNWEERQIADSLARVSMLEKKEADPYCRLTPEEELASFEIAPGYVAELFAAEPDVQEPVLTVWGGDGAMYVAEMRSYMQNVEGEGTKTLRNGRVKRLVDTDGDGRADQVTIFADNLNLPRAILPLGDWIAIRESDTLDVFAYRDSDGDGVSDEKKLLYEGGTDGRHNPDKSVEHQDSGLLWNLDNHIYISYNSERYRYVTGTWEREKQPGHWTQWGLTHDDAGDLYWITNSEPVLRAYVHPRYWEIARRLSTKNLGSGDPVPLPAPYDAAFRSAHSICLLNDRGGAAPATRGFTSACGQSVYRGAKFPHDARGNYFFCDPTIHVVRRAHLTKPGAMIHLEKAEPEGEEFFRSSDINSRFINTAEGPDGCLYVTDMYRGIIQDAPWLNPDNRKTISANGLDRNVQHGRIWRIRHQDQAPGSSPKMLGESTLALVRHLGSEAGWWRSTAQKLILLREDRDTVAPLLDGLARFSSNPLERLHALWTLDGMEKAGPELLADVIRDRDPRVRRAAVQIAEPLLNQQKVLEEIAVPLAADPDPEVAKQLILSIGIQDGHPLSDAHLEVVQKAARRHPEAAGVRLATTLTLWGMEDLPLVTDVQTGKAFEPAANAAWKIMLGNWQRGLEFPKDMDDTHRRAIMSGEVQYFQSCATCHGPDGRGLAVPGTELLLAPSLTDSARIKGDPAHLIPVFQHGLMGPIDGKTYQAGFMAPAKALGIERTDRLAELITYLRYVYGDEAGMVTKAEVDAANKLHEKRTAPWTDEELKAIELLVDPEK